MTLKHKPTPAQRSLVEQLSAFGILHQDIATMMKIDRKTLSLRYPDELKFGSIKANAKVAASLFKAANGTGPGAITAAIFWLKTRAGWREVNTIEHVGELEVIRRVIIDPGHRDSPRILSAPDTETI